MVEKIKVFFKNYIAYIEKGAMLIALLIIIGTFPADFSGVLDAGLQDIPEDELTYEDVVVEEIKIPVKAMIVGEESNFTSLKYIGILKPLEMRNRTFLNLAEIEEIYVEEGQKISIGDPLAKVDTMQAEQTVSQRAVSLNQAESSKNAAFQDMKAAEIAMNAANNNDEEAQLEMAYIDFIAKEQIYNDIKPLNETAETKLDAGEITAEEYLDIKSRYTQAESDYRQAQIKYEVELNTDINTDVKLAEVSYQSAKASYEASDAAYKLELMMYNQAKDSIEEGTLYADIDGYVISIVGSVGEIANPLMPVVVIGSEDTVVTIGISQNDIREIQIGDLATIVIGKLEIPGEVLNIAKIPDETSRTYEANISIKKEHTSFFIGETAIVNIVTGEKLGIWLPISSVLNDGQDYVYLIEDNRAVKTYVSLGDISNDKIQVIGLDAGVYVVSEGMRSIASGTLLNVVNMIIEEQ